MCAQQQSNLLILQTYANKFVEAEITKDSAVTIIKEHNEKYNQNGDFWQAEERLCQPKQIVMDTLEQ